MPSISELPKDLFDEPRFRSLPGQEKIKLLDQFDEFKGLATKEKVDFVLRGLHPTLHEEKPTEKDPGFIRTVVEDLFSMPGAMYQGARHPIDTASALIDAQIDQFRKAGKTQGVERAGHVAAGMLPLVGPVAAQAGEDIGEGRTGKGLARTAELLTPFARKPLAAGAKATAAAITPEVVKTGANLVLHPKFTLGKMLLKKLSNAADVREYRPDFRPNPNVARQARYGGPTEPRYSAPAGKPTRQGTNRAMEQVPEAKPVVEKRPGLKPAKFTPGGTEYGPAQRLAPRSPATSPGIPPPPEPFKPNKPNPNIARKTKFTPGDNPYGAAPGKPARTGINRAMQSDVGETKAAETVLPKPGEKPKSTWTGGEEHESHMARAQLQKADQAIAFLKKPAGQKWAGKLETLSEGSDAAKQFLKEAGLNPRSSQLTLDLIKEKFRKMK